MFIQMVLSVLNQNSTPIVWQEVFDNGVTLPKDVIVQVWKNKEFDWIREMVTVLNSTQRVLLSGPWYLDHLGDTFETLYTASPRHMVKGQVPDSQLDHIVGGEACMWGEMVDDTNLLSRTWPRASAVAEVLWSTTSDAVPQEALHRIEEHVCRMRRRRLPAEPPAGPGFCVVT